MIELFLRNQNAIIKAFQETGLLMGITLFFTLTIGLPLGVLLVISKKNGIKPNLIIHNLCNLYVNIVRSFPFILFVIFMMPFTRMLLGFTLGTIPATVPMSFIGVAIFARYVEQSLLEIDSGLKDTSITMGASTLQTIFYVYLVEARSSLVLGFTATVISLLSYSTVMGVVGGGGLGDFALVYGYHKHQYDLMSLIVIIIIALVQIIQWIGHTTAVKLDKN